MLQGRNKNKRAIAAIEAALLFPLLVFLLMGLLEYGWMFVKKQECNHAARQAARVGCVEGATNADVIAEVDRLMTSAGMGSSGYTLTIAPPDVATALAGESITVTVTVPYSAIDLTGAPFLPVPGSLNGRTSMAKEGYAP